MHTNFKILLISVTLLTGLMLTQCGKSTNPQLNASIIGEWQWVKSVGGFAGETRTPETEGYNEILSFNADSIFTKTRIDSTGTIISDGTYYIKYEEINCLGSIDSAKVLHSNLIFGIIDIDNVNLSIGDCYVDGFGHLYVKIR